MKTKILLTLMCLFWQVLAWGQTTVTIKTNEGKNLRGIINFLPTQNALFFHATNEDLSKTGVWRTDGTDKGTFLLSQFASISPYSSVNYNGYTYFVATSKDNPPISSIWRSDGTEGGTSLFFQAYGFPEIVFKNELYFVIQNTVGGKYSLHKTDGKTMTLVKSDLSDVSQLVESGGYLCFSANNQLWRTDGTESGTRVIKTPLGIDIDLAGALPNGCIYSADYYINNVRTFGLYITDINEKTTVLSTDRFSYLNSTAVANNKFYFYNGQDQEIWVTDGTKEKTRRISNNAASGIVGESKLFKYNNNIYQIAKKYSKDLYKIDTNNDTYSEFYNSSESFIYVNFIGSYLYFQTGSLLKVSYTDGNKWDNFGISTRNPELIEFKNEVYLEYAPNSQYASLVKIKPKSLNPACDNFNTNLKSTDSQTSIACNGNLNLSTGTSGGTAPFTYQWSYEGAIIDGANGANFSANKAGTYSVSIKDSKGCSSTTNSLTLTSNSPKIDITGNSSICPMQTITLTANANGGVSPYTYQWKQGTTNVGTNATTYATSVAGSYSVDVTDSKGCTGTSAAYSVTQKPSPNVTVSTSRTPTLLTGESVVLSVPTASGQTYQWAKDGVAISGATNNSYSVSGAGSYTVTVTGGGCTATSSAVMVSIILANEPLAEEVGLRVSPNPTVNQAKMVLQLTQSASANIYVLDASGRRVRTWESTGKATRHEVMLDMRSVAAGSYVVQAEADGQVFTEKLVKQ